MKRSDHCNADCWGRIITTRHTIIQCINEAEYTIIKHMLFCMVHGPKHPEYDLRLYAACSHLHFISKLMYYGSEAPIKLTENQYEKEIFEGSAENVDEIKLWLKRIPGYDSDSVSAVEIFRKMKIIRRLWCHMIACTRERVFLSELAHAFEYVMEKGNDASEPVFADFGGLFPSNYPDYHVEKNHRFEKIEFSS